MYSIVLDIIENNERLPDGVELGSVQGVHEDVLLEVVQVESGNF